MEILVLGGAGFIGSHLSRTLKESGHRVVVVDSLTEQVHGESPQTDSVVADEFYRADLSKSDWLTRAGLGRRFFDVVYFLVSETGTAQSMWGSQSHIRSNLLTLGILNELYISYTSNPGMDKPGIGFRRIVLTSSRAVYESCPSLPRKGYRASRESDLLMPETIYGATKVGQEALVWGGFSGAEKVVLRLQNVYGPGQPATNPYTGVVATFISRALQNMTLHLFSSLEVVRDFVFVQDVAGVLALAASSPELNGQIVNVGTGMATSIEDLANLVILHAGSHSNIIVESGSRPSLGHISAGLACTERMKLFGLACDTPLSEGLRSTIRAERESKNPQLSDDRFRNYLRELRQFGGVGKKESP